MTGLGNSGWLKGESRWKPPRVAAAAVDMKQPVVEEEAQRRAAKCKHQLNSPVPIVWRRRGRSHAKVGFTPAHVNRKNKGGEEEKTSWIERASVRLSLTARWVEFAKNCSLSLPHISAVSQRQEDLFGAGTRGYELFGPLIIYGLRFWNIIFPLNPANT